MVISCRAFLYRLRSHSSATHTWTWLLFKTLRGPLLLVETSQAILLATYPNFSRLFPFACACFRWQNCIRKLYCCICPRIHYLEGRCRNDDRLSETRLIQHTVHGEKAIDPFQYHCGYFCWTEDGMFDRIRHIYPKPDKSVPDETQKQNQFQGPPHMSGCRHSPT